MQVQIVSSQFIALVLSITFHKNPQKPSLSIITPPKQHPAQNLLELIISLKWEKYRYKEIIRVSISLVVLLITAMSTNMVKIC